MKAGYIIQFCYYDPSKGRCSPWLDKCYAYDEKDAEVIG